MSREISTVVYRTSDYSLFKKLNGNRGVDDSRVEKIKRSIEKVGYVMSPILTNEKYEIIDGQGRFTALKELELPIDYIVVPNTGLEECRQMNINQSKWTIVDYIKSYADGGNDSYKILFSLYLRYKKLGITVICNAVDGTSGKISSKIKNGLFRCTEEDCERAIKVLDFEEKFIDVVKKIKGRADCMYIAIGFCYSNEEVDNEDLLTKMRKYGHTIKAAANVEQALDQISDVYNFNNRRRRVYLSTDYKRMMDEKYKWYSEKWGKRDYQPED